MISSYVVRLIANDQELPVEVSEICYELLQFREALSVDDDAQDVERLKMREQCQREAAAARAQAQEQLTRDLINAQDRLTDAQHRIADLKQSLSTAREYLATLAKSNDVMVAARAEAHLSKIDRTLSRYEPRSAE